MPIEAAVLATCPNSRRHNVIPGMILFSLLCGALALHIYVAMLDDPEI